MYRPCGHSGRRRGARRLWRAFAREVRHPDTTTSTTRRSRRSVRSSTPGCVPRRERRLADRVALARRIGTGRTAHHLYVVPEARRGGVAFRTRRRVVEALAPDGVDTSAPGGSVELGRAERSITAGASPRIRSSSWRRGDAPGAPRAGEARGVLRVGARPDRRGRRRRASCPDFAPRNRLERDRFAGRGTAGSRSTTRSRTSSRPCCSASPANLVPHGNRRRRACARGRPGCVDGRARAGRHRRRVPVGAEFYGPLPPGDVTARGEPTVLARLTGADRRREGRSLSRRRLPGPAAGARDPRPRWPGSLGPEGAAHGYAPGLGEERAARPDALRRRAARTARACASCSPRRASHTRPS